MQQAVLGNPIDIPGPIPLDPEPFLKLQEEHTGQQVVFLLPVVGHLTVLQVKLVY